MIPIKLNVGCGRDYKQGWVNIDISRDCKADLYMDIRKDSFGVVHQDSEIKAAFPEACAEEIYISGVLEQIGSNEEFLHAMNECHRVLKPNGKMVVVVPNAKHAIAHQDPMDVRKFTIPTFQYFLKGDRHYELYGSVYGFLPWSDIQIHENERHILTVTMTK